MKSVIAACLATSLIVNLGYAALPLTYLQTTDISAVGLSSVGGMDFDDATGRLWISDGGESSNRIAAVDPITGSLFTSFSASVIPGLFAGPDALALHPVTGNLYVFSTFIESEAGVVSQAGVLLTDFGSNSGIDAGGAAFRNATDLYVVEENNGSLKTLNLATGAVLTTTPLTNFNGRLGAADFDPRTGHLIAYATELRTLLEIDVDTATVVSSTDVSAFLSNPSFPSGVAFNADGSRLFLSSGIEVAAGQIIVFSLVPEPSSLAIAALGFVAAACGLPAFSRVRRW